MRAYLERQMDDKATAKHSAKKESVHDDILREGINISTLPVDQGVDEDEEAHVKLALRQTLDQQVERKKERKKAESSVELEQQHHALGMVAAEMQEKRTRDFVNRQEEKEVLRQTWKMQQVRMLHVCRNSCHQWGPERPGTVGCFSAPASPRRNSKRWRQQSRRQRSCCEVVPWRTRLVKPGGLPGALPANPGVSWC